MVHIFHINFSNKNGQHIQHFTLTIISFLPPSKRRCQFSITSGLTLVPFTFQCHRKGFITLTFVLKLFLSPDTAVFDFYL